MGGKKDEPQHHRKTKSVEETPFLQSAVYRISRNYWIHNSLTNTAADQHHNTRRHQWSRSDPVWGVLHVSRRAETGRAAQKFGEAPGETDEGAKEGHIIVVSNHQGIQGGPQCGHFRNGEKSSMGQCHTVFGCVHLGKIRHVNGGCSSSSWGSTGGTVALFFLGLSYLL